MPLDNSEHADTYEARDEDRDSDKVEVARGRDHYFGLVLVVYWLATWIDLRGRPSQRHAARRDRQCPN